ncbi:hydrogenase expression/formation protein HypD [Geobacter metallireducens RCH3]|uniref:Hydrogenase expression/formation protein HypD n=1 Tax=Geobacter metallireducens (strain ATCC 53774 / DSM 7210 / GS-15) TaxID=269799 RepID=Q39ZF8_GEOMG|nr:hydrogenase formation protein HypD [Geobacter metallireducens]ABB30366.1 hydrogenase expression/formation protein HypD [Geobacter metallireducens GS-15]EHP85031.1 hydrogenase expression/formation protein HypD [Geobacter metallireducens RCH3]
MKYQDEFRDRHVVLGLAARIREHVAGRTEPMTFMEVCGTHTMSIYQYGLRTLLPPQVRLISGPGCPVCVTPNEYLDRAVALCRLPDVIVATFGDMVRVPGSTSSLQEERARGADIRIVYSPLDAVAIAARNPEKRVVFLGVGFETTAPAIGGSILAAKKQGLANYFVLAAHKTMPKPMGVLSADPELKIDGYICPAHVSTITGPEIYRFLAEEFHIPCVITGFEPADVMQGVEMLVRQVVAGESRVETQYSRVVRPEGNRKAQEVIREVFTPCDAPWRGIGVIPGSGLRIADAYAVFDAEKAIPVAVEETREHAGCLCGEILKGKAAPTDCPLFGGACTPESPVGACMVSSEGTCAAAYKYGQ